MRTGFFFLPTSPARAACLALALSLGLLFGGTALPVSADPGAQNRAQSGVEHASPEAGSSAPEQSRPHSPMPLPGSSTYMPPHLAPDTPPYTLGISWARLPSPAERQTGHNTGEPDDGLVLIVTLSPPQDGYMYDCDNPSGGPTRLGLFAASPDPGDLSENSPFADTVVAEMRCPQGTMYHDRFTGRDTHVYAGETALFLPIPQEVLDAVAPAAQKSLTSGQSKAHQLTLRVSMLICTSSNCTPIDDLYPISLPGLAADDSPPENILPQNILPSITDTEWVGLWQSSRTIKALPRPALAVPPIARLAEISIPGLVQNSGPARQLEIIRMPSTETGQDLTSHTRLSPEPESGTAIAPGPASSRPWHFSPRPALPGAEPGGLGKALLWGLVAGLVLNIMPCVLPVLTLKMAVLLGAGAARGPERIRLFREHNLCFAAGIMVWFLVLAAIVGGLDMAWGGLFQYQLPVALMAVLTGVLMLSMFNLCTLPAIDLKQREGGSTCGRAFANGLTATLLATPCSGPLLGGVLAWSALQPPHVLVAVFICTGLGMALPYLAFSIWPNAVALLPRPGAWLFVVERLVGVFLFGTTLYLLSILPTHLSLIICGGLALLAFLLAARRAKEQGWGARTMTRALLMFMLAGGLAAWILAEKPLASHNGQAWEAYSPELLRQTLGNEPILLEFTADWCPNCKALEIATLDRSRLMAWKKQHGLRLIRVDMTERDPDTDALLRALGSISIPLTAVFPAGEDAHRPYILRDVYSGSTLESVLKLLDARP